MNWNKLEDRLPDQGKKVLCMHKGDYYVAQRFGVYWFQIPFVDSALSFIKAPDYWCEIDFIGNDKGYFKIIVDGIHYTVDEFENDYFGEYQDFIYMMLKHYDSTHPEGRYEP